VSGRTILVTGGAGYIGSHLTRRLLARGDRVRVLDRFLYGDHGLVGVLDHPALTVLEADVRDAGAMADAVEGVDTVIALAALVGDAACDLAPEETRSINGDATALLAETCIEAGVRRLVFTSSCSVYGAGTEPLLHEDSLLNPVSAYAVTRVHSERILAAHAGRLGAVTLRFATVFGLSPRMRLDLLVNTFAAQAFHQGWIRVFGGPQWRPNLHVQDAVSALLLAADAPDHLVRGQTFNVGDDGANHTVLEVAGLVAAALPGTRVETLPHSGDARDYRVSFAKVRAALGFRARVTVADGIAEIVDACRDGTIPALGDPRYSNVECLKTFGFRGAARARAA
jgi:nucleoside-diphosphate-sugar epimerase